MAEGNRKQFLAFEARIDAVEKRLETLEVAMRDPKIAVRVQGLRAVPNGWGWYRLQDVAGTVVSNRSIRIALAREIIAKVEAGQLTIEQINQDIAAVIGKNAEAAEGEPRVRKPGKKQRQRTTRASRRSLAVQAALEADSSIAA